MTGDFVHVDGFEGDTYVSNIHTRNFNGREYILMSTWMSVDAARNEAQRLRDVTKVWNNPIADYKDRLYCSARVTKEMSEKWKSFLRPKIKDTKVGTYFWAVWIPIMNMENSRVFEGPE